MLSCKSVGILSLLSLRLFYKERRQREQIFSLFLPERRKPETRRR